MPSVSMNLRFLSLATESWFQQLTLLAFVVFGYEASKLSTDKYSCSRTCRLGTGDILSWMEKARYKTVCAAYCSRSEWCSGFVFRKNSSSSSWKSVSGLSQCAVFADDGSVCSGFMLPDPDTVMCLKVTNETESNLSQCGIITQTVLNVTDQRPSVVDHGYLWSLLTAGTEMKVQYVTDASKYITTALSFTADSNMTGTNICVTALHSLTGWNSKTVLPFVLEFCSNSSVAARTSDPSLLSNMTVPKQFSWHIQRGRKSPMGNFKTVFSPGTNLSVLEKAVKEGSDIKLLLSKDNSLLSANMIFQNNKISSNIVSQTTLYKSGKFKIVLQVTNGTFRVLDFDAQSQGFALTDSGIQGSTWVSDMCWRLLHITDSAPNPGLSLDSLEEALDSGRRIRVRFIISDLAILATPDCVVIIDSQTLVVHILRVLAEKSLLEAILGSLSNLSSVVTGLFNSNQKWTHYGITSSGEVLVLDAGTSSSSSDPPAEVATVYWYAEEYNYTLVHTSSPQNPQSLARLATEALQGKAVRVKVSSATKRAYFTCSVVQVTDNGQEVRCYIRGQLPLDILGTAPPSTQNNVLGLNLPPVIGIGPLPASTAGNNCFQDLLVLASNGSMDSAICPEYASSVKINVTQPQNVDWFVSE